MKRALLIAAIGIYVFAGVTGEAPHADHPHWGYEHGKYGPEHWADIDPKFRICALGANQSPVNLNRWIEAKLPSPKVKYAGIAHDVVNNGHTVKVTTLGINDFMIDGIAFRLKQFHFHTPSENRIDGKSFPMEAHFVHQSKDGEYLVVAVMFKNGKKNIALQKVLNDLDPNVGNKKTLHEQFNPGELFPKRLDYYRYDGSFTTPPCTEGVRWIVLKYLVEASKEQLAKLHKIMGNNNRPVQPLHARVILK